MPIMGEMFKVVASLGLGASAASAVGVAADSLAGAGGDEGSASGEEEGLVLSVSEDSLDGEDASSDDSGVAAGELELPFEDDLGLAAGELAAFEGADAGEGDFLGDPVGDLVGELVGAALAETNPTRATKTRARTII